MRISYLIKWKNALTEHSEEFDLDIVIRDGLLKFTAGSAEVPVYIQMKISI